MNKHLFLLGIIVSSSLSAMENKPAQIKIPQSSEFKEYGINWLSIVRKYEHGDNKSVTLVPMQHFASPEFYRAVEELMRDQVVIYELFGGNWNWNEKQIKEERENLASLGDDYVQAYALLCDKDAQTAKFGIVSQDLLSYGGCKKIIRADFGNMLEIMPASQREQLMRARSSASFKNIVDEKYRSAMMKPYFYFKQKHCPSVYLTEPCEHDGDTIWVSPKLTARWRELDTTVSSGEVFAAIEDPETINIGLLKKILPVTGPKANAKDEFFLLMEKQKDEAKPGTLWPPEGSDYPKNIAEQVFCRNQCIFDKLDEFLVAPGTGSVMVVYGSWHMPFVEEYLLARGFAQAGDPLKLTFLTRD
jgi:hypothetical protein